MTPVRTLVASPLPAALALSMAVGLGAAGCHVQATLAIVLPDEATALATARIEVAIAQPGGRRAAEDLCADPAATFEETIDVPYPVADGMLPDLKTRWYAVRARAKDVAGVVIAEACEAVKVGIWRKRVEVVLVASGAGDAGTDAGNGDGGTDAGPDGATGDGGSDAAPSDAGTSALDALAVTVRTAEPPALAVSGAIVFVTDSDGDTVMATSDAAGLASFGPGAALAMPLDVTVRLVIPPGGLDYQQTVLDVSPGGGALDVRVPTPFEPATPMAATITGTVVGSGAGTSATVAFVDAASASSGSGPVSGPGDAYDVMVNDAAGTFSGLLHEAGGTPERIAVLAAVMLSPAPPFDLGALAVPRGTTSNVALGPVPAAYDGTSGLEIVVAGARGAMLVEALAGPGPSVTTVFDPAAAALPVATRLRVGGSAASSATVAACGGAASLSAESAVEGNVLPTPADFTLALADAPVAVTPSEGAPTYPTFSAGAAIDWTPPAPTASAGGTLATVVAIDFTRASDGAPARLVLVVPPGVTSAGVPDPAAVGPALTDDDGSGYCLTVAHVEATGATFDVDAGRATALAVGWLGGAGTVVISRRVLAFTR